MTRWACIAFFLIASAVPDSGHASAEILLSRPGFLDQLTQSSVYQSFQDSRGALWFVTQEGLNKYIGYELENYRSTSNAGSLPSNIVTRITEGSDGNIWLSTIGGGLARYDSVLNNFESISADSNNRDTPYSNDIHAIFADSQGHLWLGYTNGYSYFDPKERSFRHFISGNGDLPFTGKVSSFTQTPDGRVWATTESSGLLEIDPSSFKSTTHQHKPSDPNSIVQGRLIHLITDRNGLIWLASAMNGVSQFDPNSNKAKNFAHIDSDFDSLPSNQASDVYEDATGRIWIATTQGLALFMPEQNTFSIVTQNNSNIPDDDVLSIYQTSEGMYWIGTQSGMVAGTQSKFEKFDDYNTNLSNNSVNVFAETDDGSLWVGTDDGLNRLKQGAERFEWINESSLPPISSPIVMSLYADGKYLWVGTFDGGLNQIDLSTNAVNSYKHSSIDKSSIGADGITSILRLSSGQLLIGTYGGGLSILDPLKESFENLKTDIKDPNSISNNMVLTLYEDSLGDVWVGTEGGLNLLDIRNRSFSRFTLDRKNPDSLSNNVIWTLFEDADHNLWVGTGGGGLNKWGQEDRESRRDYFHHYYENVSLPSSAIYGIQQDESGWLWVSHNRGVTRIDPKNLDSHQYGVQDGLQAVEFNFGASFKSREEIIYFGGGSGYNAIDPSKVGNKRLPPKVSISQIKVMNERRHFSTAYQDLESIELGYQDRMVSIEFFAADYSSPQLVNYAYKLEGLNPDWIVSTDWKATFTTLPPGTYKLKLAASSPDGTWNWDGFEIPIAVAPPPWRSVYAYIAYSLVAIVFIAYYFFRQAAIARLALARQRELERRVEERTIDLKEARKVAEDATKAKSEFLATMSHEIRTPMHGIIGMTELLMHTNLSQQQKQFAHAAHSSGSSLLSLINEILDFSKVEASRVDVESIDFDLTTLIDDICYLQGEPANRKGLELNNICHPSTPSKLIGDPTKIRQVIMNLVSNSIKFTNQGAINVRVEPKFHPNQSDHVSMLICVEDTGIGMDDETQARVFEPFAQADTSTTRKYGGTGLGLSISRHYIELMGGSITVKSSKGEGTKIAISLDMTTPEQARLIKPRGAYGDLNARILTDSAYTYEMASSHLARLGITSSPLLEEELQSSYLPEGEILIVDYSDDLFTRLNLPDPSNLNRTTCILLVPLTEESIHPKSINWKTIAKPITQESLVNFLVEFSPSNSGDGPERDEDFQNATSQQPNGVKSSILVAEDVKTNQTIIREMIQLLGHEVDIAGNGELAVGKYLSGKYSLIFMDCQMPNMDGYAATRKIREYESEHKLLRTPIIALTAGSDDQDRERCKLAGMDGYVAKPFSIYDIETSISTHLGQQNDASKNTLENSPSHTIEVMEFGEEKILDQPTIEGIRNIEKQTGKPILNTIFGGYIEQMDEKLLELRDNLDKGELEVGQKTAHAIKSMSANIGARNVRLLATRIEDTCRSRESRSQVEAFEELEGAYRDFINAFQETFMQAS